MNTEATVVTVASPIGSIVKYKDTLHVIVDFNDDMTKYKILNPLTNAKHVVLSGNISPTRHDDCKCVQYRDTKYLVTAKDTIISLVTNRVMKWDQGHGMRATILDCVHLDDIVLPVDAVDYTCNTAVLARELLPVHEVVGNTLIVRDEAVFEVIAVDTIAEGSIIVKCGDQLELLKDCEDAIQSTFNVDDTSADERAYLFGYGAPKHVEGTSCFEIINDGWSRGFEQAQIIEECAAMGYVIDNASIQSITNLISQQYEADTCN